MVVIECEPTTAMRTFRFRQATHSADRGDGREKISDADHSRRIGKPDRLDADRPDPTPNEISEKVNKPLLLNRFLPSSPRSQPATTPYIVLL